MCIKVGKKPGIICVHRPLTYTHVRASSTVLCGIYHYFGLVYNRGQQYQFVEGQYQYLQSTVISNRLLKRFPLFVIVKNLWGRKL